MKKLYRLALNDVNQSNILKKSELKQIKGGYYYGVACWYRFEHNDALIGVKVCDNILVNCQYDCNTISDGIYCECFTGYIGN